MLRDALLFDGTKPFPKEAREAVRNKQDYLKDRRRELREAMKRATETAEKTTEAVNIGKRLETVLPTLRNFDWVLQDCRFMNDPIDFVAFNGMSMNMVKSVSFIEVKTGKARLNKHQKAVKEALEDGRLKYGVYR